MIFRNRWITAMVALIPVIFAMSAQAAPVTASGTLSGQSSATGRSQAKFAGIAPGMNGPYPGHWTTRVVFNGYLVKPADPDMCFYHFGAGACRTLLPSASAIDYAKAYCSICKELHVQFKRQGATVYVRGILAGHSPHSVTITVLDQHGTP